MELIDFLKLIKKKKQTIFSITLLFFLISAVLTFIQPFKYSSESRLLVVQSIPAGVDPYQVNKANEYIAEVLAQIIPTNSFFNDVINTEFNINKTYFPSDPLKQLKKWRKTVKAHVSNNGGMISISVLHPDKYQSNQILKAVDYLIQKNHTLYHGSGENVSVKIVDQPFTSIFPVSPNIPLNLIFGLVLGLIFSLTYIFLFPEEVYNLRFLPKRKRKNINFQMEIDENQFKEDLIKQNNQNLEKLYNQEVNEEERQEYMHSQVQKEAMEDDFVIRGSMENLGVNKVEV